MARGGKAARLVGGFFGRRAGRFFRRARKREEITPRGFLRDARERGGFTWSPHTRRPPDDGYMVALTGHTVQHPASLLDDLDASAVAIDDYLMRRRSLFENDRDVYLGGWIEDGKLWLEPSRNVRDRAAAVRLARETDQIAIYDVRAGTTIDTGGAGGFL
ncbi:hypothetical protein [Nonomuraea cavernae]|uniref:hypothetical protein n=1 Tax=Nonomuraea cavernae TaxID=2045107 RepID=UPI00340006C3